MHAKTTLLLIAFFCMTSCSLELAERNPSRLEAPTALKSVIDKRQVLPGQDVYIRMVTPTPGKVPQCRISEGGLSASFALYPFELPPDDFKLIRQAYSFKRVAHQFIPEMDPGLFNVTADEQGCKISVPTVDAFCSINEISRKIALVQAVTFAPEVNTAVADICGNTTVGQITEEPDEVHMRIVDSSGKSLWRDADLFKLYYHNSAEQVITWANQSCMDLMVQITLPDGQREDHVFCLDISSSNFGNVYF